LVAAHITVSWEDALKQFTSLTVSRSWGHISTTFPDVGDAPQSAQKGLLSLVFDRGTAMEGGRRKEMRSIMNLVADERWVDMPTKFRKMRRLWPNTPSLLKRRGAEARHIQTACPDHRNHRFKEGRTSF
jgi:hypothetical protein